MTPKAMLVEHHGLRLRCAKDGNLSTIVLCSKSVTTTRKNMLKLEVVQRRLIFKAELERERALSDLGRQDGPAVNTGVQDG